MVRPNRHCNCWLIRRNRLSNYETTQSQNLNKQLILDYLLTWYSNKEVIVMAKFRRLVLLSLSLGLALAGGCRSPDALAATPTDTSVTLTDWQAGTDLTNFQHPRPYQYLAVPNIIATANQQASTQTPSSAAIRPDKSVLPQTNEARQLLVWLGLLTAVLAGWLVWLMQRRRE